MLLDQFFMKSFEQEYRNLIESVYFGTRPILMKGKEADIFYENLKKSNQQLPKIEAKMANKLKIEMIKIQASYTKN